MGIDRVGRLIVRHSARLKGYAPDALPGRSEGVMAFDNQRKVPAWWDGNNHEFPTFVDPDDVETSSKTVSNTTDETEVFRFTVDDAALVEGRLLIARIFGKYNTAASQDNFTYRVKMGPEGFDPTSEGTTITSVQTVQANVSDGPWQVKTTSTVFSAGQNGTIATHSEGAFNNNKRDDHVDPITIDTTTAEDIAGTVEWNNAKAGNTMTRGQAYLQQSA